MDILDVYKIPRAVDKNQIKEGNCEAILDELEKTRDLCIKLDTIIENSPDGIYITDGDANAIRINPAFERISGLKRELMLGRNHRDLIKDKIVARSSALMVVEQRQPVTIIHEYIPTNRQALATSIPIFDENREITMIVSNIRDLTELNDLKSKLAIEKECRLKYEQQIEMIKSQLIDTEELIAVDKKTLDMLYVANRMSIVDSTVLITGETGAGKEEVAKYIHKHSARSHEHFITINCGAIPESLVESELFGYENGSFTGARKEGKPGMLEVADKGTVFLDEVGELPLDIQVKLLRALQERTITRVGGTKPIAINVRIISATNRDLMKMVKEHKFREDLFYRLSVVPIKVPSLRDRVDDIIPLANTFLNTFNEKYGYKKTLSHMAYRELLKYQWPGNVRELKNVIERIIVSNDSDTITAEDLPMHQDIVWCTQHTTENIPMKDRLEMIEYNYIEEAYAKFRSVRKAAESLGMTMPTFVRKRQLYEKKYSL